MGSRWLACYIQLLVVLHAAVRGNPFWLDVRLLYREQKGAKEEEVNSILLKKSLIICVPTKLNFVSRRKKTNLSSINNQLIQSQNIIQNVVQQSFSISLQWRRSPIPVHFGRQWRSSRAFGLCHWRHGNYLCDLHVCWFPFQFYSASNTKGVFVLFLNFVVWWLSVVKPLKIFLTHFPSFKMADGLWLL